MGVVKQMSKCRVRNLVSVVCAIGFSMTSVAQAADKYAPVDGTTKAALELIEKFSNLAGSTANSDALVTGLRTGRPIVLTNATETKTTFTPPTKAMGFGNINIALSLVQSELTKLGIAQPTPAQLQAALAGGVITTSTGPVTLAGILTLRSKGTGWGEIAHQMGFKLGEVVRSSKAEQNDSHAKDAPDGDGDDFTSKHALRSDRGATPAVPATEATPAGPSDIDATRAHRAVPSSAAANPGQSKRK
jgi:hypothetical protein